jgi:hypothetical protein
MPDGSNKLGMLDRRKAIKHNNSWTWFRLILIEQGQSYVWAIEDS